MKTQAEPRQWTAGWEWLALLLGSGVATCARFDCENLPRVAGFDASAAETGGSAAGFNGAGGGFPSLGGGGAGPSGGAAGDANASDAAAESAVAGASSASGPDAGPAGSCTDGTQNQDEV